MRTKATVVSSCTEPERVSSYLSSGLYCYTIGQTTTTNLHAVDTI